MILTGFDLSRLSRAEKLRLYALLQEKSERAAGRKLWTYYPEAGPLARSQYVKHLSYFEAGARYRQRLMLAANRVGKTEGVGGYETTLHLTGLYPEWWNGRRFSRPIRAWAAGDTSQTVRDILQEKLLGPVGAFGTGLIPRDCIVEVRAKSHGVADAVESVVVKHVSGGFSRLVFKSYDQKRKSFQGTEQDLIWLDEEPPLDVYAECLMRTMTTDGLVLLTFTPLLGMSEVVLSFLEDGRIPDEAETYVADGKFVVMATWDDAPHLTPEKKAAMLAEMPPHQRDARTKGVPQLGAGAIYPVPEEFYLVDDFTLPVHWPRGYGLDVGWNCTAAVWGAWDRESDIIYVTSVHKRGLAEPVVHAEAIKARGSWMMGTIDPASMGSGQKDGKSLMGEYENLGLHLVPAINAVEAGIHDVWTRLSTGRLKIFRSCMPLVAEMRLYRRDDTGKVVKKDDHACDGLRYLVHTRDDVFQSMPVQLAYPERLAAVQAPVGVVEYNPYAD
jgi:phage terminase large subunit-like protein